MPLVPGNKIGPYEIVSPLGAGGMGEVYRASDARLNRTVAIKILPEPVSRDPVRKQRFEREAKTISSLNHPHICVVHDIGQQDGIDYLVMECVEGETLAKRLEKGPLPLGQVLKFGAQMADALDKAHRGGVVHRDLKPGNIMLTTTGAKLLDFGLAKPVAALTSVATLTAAAMQDSPVTELGTIVGTFQYMSPEQVEGKEVDGRSDIFSLGAVLYEMVTGRRAFGGKSQLSVASAILEKDPEPISTIQPLAPPALDRTIRVCLAKDPEERWQTARDLLLELKWIAERGSQADVPPLTAQRQRFRERLPWLLVAALMLLLAALGAWSFSRLREKPDVGRTIRFQFNLPENLIFRIADSPVLSPDGTRVAFTALAGNDAHIWLRRLDSLSTEMLPGTEGASAPFWSYDGNSIAFFAAGKLKRIDLTGGAAQILCDASGVQSAAGAWNRDGVILFRQTSPSPLYRISATGGEAKPFTELDASALEVAHLAPAFLPDGRHFLYSASSFPQGGTTAYIGSLDSKEKKRILVTDSIVAYTQIGYVLYVRGGTLFAQQLDAKRLDLAGDPVPVVGQVAQFLQGSAPSAAFSVSQNGVLSYRADSGGTSELIWFDRHGNRLGKVGSPAQYSNPSISPDGSRVAIGRLDPQPRTRDLWVFDLKRGTGSRLTFDAADDLNPVWTHDGSRIFFTSDRKGQRDVYEKPANGTGTETLVFESKQSKSADDLSSDGRYLIYDTSAPPHELWILPLFGDRKPFPFIQGQIDAQSAQFSPDSHFIAYSSNETGRNEIYVQTFLEQRGKWQVSTDGGIQPMWRHDGKELFYIGQTKLMAVDVKTDGNSFQPGIPKPLYDLPTQTSPGRNYYATTPDGQRFLFITAEPGQSTAINVVVNWPAELRK